MSSFTSSISVYSSEHAIFDDACFQIARLFYKKRDNRFWSSNESNDIEFKFVFDEFNDVSRDLNQSYDRTQSIIN